jgi:DNA helicase HerA-like ATPase
LVDKIEQIVRLIRSKGVGIYFISQSPLDIPDDILGQLGLKIQHALRAYTPKDKKVISAVLQTPFEITQLLMLKRQSPN